MSQTKINLNNYKQVCKNNYLWCVKKYKKVSILESTIDFLFFFKIKFS